MAFHIYAKDKLGIWLPKSQRNVKHDARKVEALRALVWRVLIV